jgi:hypothetical protein
MCLVWSGVPAGAWWLRLQPRREIQSQARLVLPRRHAEGSIPSPAPFPFRLPRWSRAAKRGSDSRQRLILDDNWFSATHAGPRRGTLLQSAVGPPSPSMRRSWACADAIPAESSSRLQVAGEHHLRGIALVLVGRRSVPPAERPGTGVGVEMGRVRPPPNGSGPRERYGGGVAHPPTLNPHQCRGAQRAAQNAQALINI